MQALIEEPRIQESQAIKITKPLSLVGYVKDQPRSKRTLNDKNKLC